MKRFLALSLIALILYPAWAQDKGQVLLAGTPTSIRTAAILTTADVASTTLTLPTNAKAMHLYVAYTKGDSSGVCITPFGQSNTSTTLYANDATSFTLAAAGNYAHRIDAREFGGRYVGFYVRGMSYATGTLCGLSYRLEYE